MDEKELVEEQAVAEEQEAEGLEDLQELDQLLVRQEVEILEVAVDWEQNNKYQICNNLGQSIFFLQEETSGCSRHCCGPERSFDLFMRNVHGDDVLHLHRDCACAPCGWPCFFCCICFCEQAKQIVTVNGLGEVEIGKLSLERTCFAPTIRVENSFGNQLFSIVGSCCQLTCGKDIEYKIFNVENEEIGNIVKQFNSHLMEGLTDADNFLVQFPKDLSTNEKALLLAATFMNDFLFFEA